MGARWRNRSAVTAAIILCAIGGTVGLALSPTNACVHNQAEILIAGAYRDVPGRAYDSARIMCARNDNVPMFSLR